MLKLFWFKGVVLLLTETTKQIKIVRWGDQYTFTTPNGDATDRVSNVTKHRVFIWDWLLVYYMDILAGWDDAYIMNYMFVDLGLKSVIY